MREQRIPGGSGEGRRAVRRLATTALALGLLLAPASARDARAAAIAGNDAYGVNEDSTLVVDAAGGVLLNDSDDGGAPICVVGVDVTGLTGTLEEWAPDGSFTFVPSPDWSGQTSFTYGLASGESGCDDNPQAFGTVTITVAPVNDAPTARADSFQALRDQVLNIAAPGVLANDIDVEGGQLIAQKVTNPAHGVVTLGADGGFSYTPTAGYVGPDGFSYRASDGTATSPVRVVTINITALPTAAPTVAPVPTAAPTVAPTATAAPSSTASTEPSASSDPFASASAGPSPGPSASPGASLGPEDPAADEGGLPIPVIGVGLLLLALLAFGGAVYLPKWLEQRRGDEEVPPGE